jgi:hypothetical protein
MKTIERNFTKNPHTARFLQTFHTAVTSAGVDHRATEKVTAADEDLLASIPVDVPVRDTRTPRQAELMANLVDQITVLDTETGRKAAEYTIGMTENGLWTPGREGNASAWISRMIAKISELKTAAVPARPTTTTKVEIPAGRYAVETDEIRCYMVDYGKAGTRWEGFLFLNRISSDDRFPIKNPAAKAEILAAIRADVAASELLAALTLRQCIRCGRTLSDTKNPHFHRGFGPDCGEM